jgi:hydroxyacylglutathione hydrolase
MTIEQIYTGCLAQGAYYIESDGEVAIVDPLRETDAYIKRAARDHARIRYVLETHFHADFVSGHLDLAHRTGAAIVYGPEAKPSFPFYAAKDNEELILGKIKIRVLHTPGHTMESTCYLLIDEKGKETALFSGDTLFIGDVGRPDLAQKVKAELTQTMLAGLLYRSLRHKIMPLPDDVIVYPAHGAGSACGKNMSTETSDTLGHQKQTNYALRADMTEEEFIVEVTKGLTEPPAYFPSNVMMNIRGYENHQLIMQRALHPLSPDEFETKAREKEVMVLDTRDAQIFAGGFIPGSINIGLNGSFAPWAGTLIPDIQQRVLIVADPGREEEVIIRLSRVGIDHVTGFLDGGFASWEKAGKETDHIMSVSAAELSNDMALLDVRKESEYDSEHVIGAVNIPLDYINATEPAPDPHTTYYVYCAGGYRSMIFISMMKRRGYNKLIDVRGGLKAIKENGKLPLTAYHCPVTML